MELFAAGGLFGAFACVVLWFRQVDFYHRHFFDAGTIVFVDNTVRVIFALVLCWLIYAPGAGIIALVERWRTSGPIRDIRPVEHAILGFGIGFGVWHAILLIVGELGLYYRSAMIVLCSAVLLGSAKHFGRFARSTGRVVAHYVGELRSGRNVAQAIGAASVALAAVCLLLVRGLYPGGGHDYYMHYFYYYLQVLKSHGLAPNDVWYQYWYSKGYGLFFLSMLLTDPEAPAAVTFCCVAFAALALAALGARMVPGSWWPALAAMLYLLFNLVSLSDNGGGEFQKDHELVSALLVLVTWALCMALASRDRLFVVMASSAGIGAAIVAQPMGLLIGLLLGLRAGLALLKKSWRDVWTYSLASASVGAALFAVFLINYLATGLVSDQSLDLTLRYADIAKLDRWGVIPQLVIVAWIRDNYEALARPFDLAILAQLSAFTRFGVLWSYFAGLGLFALIALTTGRLGSACPPLAVASVRPPHATYTPVITLRVGSLLAILAAVSPFVGRVQTVSYERFSTFFVPLLIMLGTAGCGWLLLAPFPPRREWTRRFLAPSIVLFAVVTSWQIEANWLPRVARATINGLKFFTGIYSLADAYSHQDIGPSFGGINPEALAAWRHTDPAAPIWATSIDSYCMAPGCVIETITSFDLSPRFDEIVTGSPELAKHLLQDAGINYFLFLKDSQLLDILPYSQLFAPETIGRYLGVKWTDGSAYLLTWIGQDTRPIGADFRSLYAQKLAEPAHPWFLLGPLAEQIGTATASLREKQWGAAPVFSWRIYAPAAGNVDIVDASFGRNCGVVRGIWNRQVRQECRDKKVCTFEVSASRFGDPAWGCLKSFSITYRCAPGAAPETVVIPPDANGHSVTLDCTIK